MAKGDPKSRVLRKLMDGAYLYTEDFSVTGLDVLTAATGGPGAGNPIGHEGWEIYTQATMTTQFAVNRQYFDLEGYLKEDTSFFPSAPQVQDMGDFQGTLAFRVYDLFTVKPIDDAQLELWFNMVARPTPPGSNWNLLDLQDIIYAQWRIYDPSEDTGSAKITQSGTYGLGTATARDRIFITRLVTCVNTDNQIVFVPPSAWVLGGVSAEEKDLVYMERLRRSYDHSAST